MSDNVIEFHSPSAPFLKDISSENVQNEIESHFFEEHSSVFGKSDPMPNFTPAEFAKLPFFHAAMMWLYQCEIRGLKEKTLYEYRNSINTLTKFIGVSPLREIDYGVVEGYQQMRRETISERTGRRIGASSINNDTVVLRMILQRGGCWTKVMEDNFTRICTRASGKRKVMTEEERDLFFAILASNENWEVAYWVSLIGVNSSAVGVEIRLLQLKHLFLEDKIPTFQVPTDVKNQYRERIIPILHDSMMAVLALRDRAHRLGAGDPEHYLVPLRGRDGYDVTQPATQGFIRASFEAAREHAGLPWLTPHCLRHQAISEMGEAGVPDAVIKSMAGHVSQRMLEHYSHGRISAKMEAVSAVQENRKKRA